MLYHMRSRVKLKACVPELIDNLSMIRVSSDSVLKMAIRIIWFHKNVLAARI